MGDRQTKLVALELLRGGRAVLSIPGAWGREVYASNSAGIPVDVQDESACVFCGLGAVLAIARRSGSERSRRVSGAFSMAFHRLNDGAGGNMVAMNDRSSSVDPIIAAYDQAIAKLEAEVHHG